MSWVEMKSLNSTVGTSNFRPIDKIVLEAIENLPTGQTKTVELSLGSGDQIIYPDTKKVLTKATIKKPSTLTAENIVKGVNIAGVIGAYERLTYPLYDGSYTLTEF